MFACVSQLPGVAGIPDEPVGVGVGVGVRVVVVVFEVDVPTDVVEVDLTVVEEGGDPPYPSR